ncbi:hypothetical protein DLAC_04340 [Tieghemostelium lacteum]|uniref:Biogenesis of lysosome-related organelles complex 1 subunit 5 n=1 Tax=Tieghemostelium lacteum TaxID=361077 RepID=A0A151ZJH6_TIELA|nr:hypothetical protein DLAC_04340 [Tieghemostelium lacteum]|eukprot:KYQ94065.1 hypothetical protein DLAC_04340 [Tieghemostelium lacteum]
MGSLRNILDKKITFGPVEGFVKDIGGLYDYYFDQSTFIESEIKTFLKEHEQKRGDRDIYGLHVQTVNANNTINNSKICINHSNINLDKINQSLDNINKKISDQLQQEVVHQSQIEQYLTNRYQSEFIERQQLEDSYNDKKNSIDQEFIEKSNQLRDKYQIVI